MGFSRFCPPCAALAGHVGSLEAGSEDLFQDEDSVLFQEAMFLGERWRIETRSQDAESACVKSTYLRQINPDGGFRWGRSPIYEQRLIKAAVEDQSHPTSAGLVDPLRLAIEPSLNRRCIRIHDLLFDEFIARWGALVSG